MRRVKAGFICTVHKGFFPLLIFHISRDKVGFSRFPISCGALPGLAIVIIKIRNRCTSAPHMERRGCHSRLKIFHGENLAVKAAAYVGCMGVERCHDLILPNIQGGKTVLLCRAAEISFFSHDQAPCIVL